MEALKSFSPALESAELLGQSVFVSVSVWLLQPWPKKFDWKSFSFELASENLAYSQSMFSNSAIIKKKRARGAPSSE